MTTDIRRRLLVPIALTGAESLRVGAGSRLAKPSRKRRPQGGLDAVPASWTIGAEEDGAVPYRLRSE
jgi:hypothetical protein